MTQQLIGAPRGQAADWQMQFTGGNEYRFAPCTQAARDWLLMSSFEGMGAFLGGNIYVKRGEAAGLLDALAAAGFAVAVSPTV